MRMLCTPASDDSMDAASDSDSERLLARASMSWAPSCLHSATNVMQIGA